MASRPKKSRSRRQRKEQPEQQEVEQQLLDARHAQAELMASVVKVLCTHVEPNYSLPWQMRRQNQSASTGGPSLTYSLHCLSYSRHGRQQSEYVQSEYVQSEYVLPPNTWEGQS